MGLLNLCSRAIGRGVGGFERPNILGNQHGGTMAERAKALALLLQVGLMQVRILEAARRGKNVLIIGKPPAPNSVPYVPQHIDGRPAM